MKLNTANRNRTRKGHILLFVLVASAISLLLLGSMLQWTSVSSQITERNNEYNRAVAAAEAATETVLARMDRDFLSQSIDYANLEPYRALVPDAALTSGWPVQYQFSDTSGVVNRSSVLGFGQTVSTNLGSELAGLYGLAFPCRLTANARRIGGGYGVPAAVQQDFQLVAIPVFQFAVFYAVDLEICPSPLMKITGKVHSNASIYAAPVTGLEFVDTVTAVGKIINDRMPDDPQHGSTKVEPVFDSTHTEKASSLTLPIGANNNPAEVVKVLDPPPFGESALSPIGQQRYYNKVDLIVTTVGPSGDVTVKTGLWDGFAAVPPDVAVGTNPPSKYSFVRSDPSFTDGREAKVTLTTEIDVGAFNQWLTNAGAAINGLARLNTGHQLNSIYVDDQRVDAAKLTVARVTNGQQLPPDGLTVATRLPLYVQGHFNAPDATPALANTAATKPASLVGDAITVLSANWLDANSALAVSSRAASDTTVNAAFLAGIVQTANVAGIKHYSGGVENFPRFLESWTGKTFTYNGSMVSMFSSRYATSFWGNSSYYNPPKRSWAFDRNFLVYAKLPPCTPQVRKVMRNAWNVVAASAP
jgi:hypothetical protein